MSLSKPCAVPAPAATDIGALPLDTLCEILLRLDAKELCRLRVVCRLWRRLLSARHFADAHAARNPQALIIAAYKDDAGRDVRDVLVDIMDLSGQVVKRVWAMVGDRAVSVPLDRVCIRNVYDTSCSSYRLDTPMRGEVFYLPEKLLDPATGAAQVIPDGYAEEHLELARRLIDHPTYLFWQVPSTGEYKVFRMLFHFSIKVGGQQMLEVCTVHGDNSWCSGWRRLEPPDEGILEFCRFTSVVIEGVVYFLRQDPHDSITFKKKVLEEELIVTFNLETEAWGPSLRAPPITFPEDASLKFYYLGLPNVQQLTLAKLKGSLAVVHGPAPDMHIWILLDFDKGLWVKQYSIQFDKYDILDPVNPLFVLGDGRIVIYKQNHEFLMIYDPRTNTLTDSVGSKRFSAVERYAGNLLAI